MSYSLEKLEAVRDSFNAFEDSKILKQYIKNRDRDRLDFEEITLLIKNKELRREYCQRAIELLEANLKYEEPHEELIRTPKMSDFKIYLLSFIGGYLISIYFGKEIGFLAGLFFVWRLEKNANTLSSTDIAQNETAKERRIMNDEWREDVRKLKLLLKTL
jgi:hypothetical protein